MRPFAAILKKSLEVRTRGFILSTAVACLGGDVGCGPVQGGRRKVRMREEKGRHHGRRRFSPQPESGSGAGAAGGGGWGKTAPPLFIRALGGDAPAALAGSAVAGGVSGCRSRFSRSPTLSLLHFLSL